MVFVLSLFLLAQVGPFAGTPDKAMQLPPELREREASPAPGQALPGEAASPKLAQCLASVRADAQKTVRFAEGWMSDARGSNKADAAHCLGVAHSRLGRLGEAYAALIAGRDAAPPGDHARRARLGAMAGNAALAEGQAHAALEALEIARGDALAVSDQVLAGDIGVDRARALVMLERDDEASAALAEARQLAPQSMYSWLFSAALARRRDKLAEAQTYIERASELGPADPEVGLEAGRIAILAGRKDAARRSWQSVVDTAPESETAAIARGYLAQLAQNEGAAP